VAGTVKFDPACSPVENLDDTQESCLEQHRPRGYPNELAP
jgi:hypothetical protein